MNFYPQPVHLHDCDEHGSDSRAELFIVEGDSASQAVAAVRDPCFQAVLPMQGKPLNASKASWGAVREYELYQQAFVAFGYPQLCSAKQLQTHEARPEACHFSKILLLFDPDADGIHCGALMLIFLHRVFPKLIDAGMIEIVRAPLVCFDLIPAYKSTASKTLYAYLDEQAGKLRSELDREGYEYNQRRFRGLASMDRDTLVQTCVDLESRTAQSVTAADAQAALAVFGGGR